VLFFLIVMPLVVAAGTSLLLVRREASTATGTALRHPPRAAGFGSGGRPVPVAPESHDAGLDTLLEPDYYRPWWLRALRIAVLAALLGVAAAAIAAGIYELGKLAGQALKDFVTKG
jgi:hypothetical protein